MTLAPWTAGGCTTAADSPDLSLLQPNEIFETEVWEYYYLSIDFCTPVSPCAGSGSGIAETIVNAEALISMLLLKAVSAVFNSVAVWV